MIKLLIILLLFIAQSAGAQLATGSGTIGDPYQIWYLEDLAAIQTNQPGYFKMMADLDFDDPASYESGTVNTAWTTGTGWTPFNVTDCFLDGNNKTISNLYSNQVSAGLFLVYSASIATTSIMLNDITLDGANLSGTDAVAVQEISGCAVENVSFRNAVTTGVVSSGFSKSIDGAGVAGLDVENVLIKATNNTVISPLGDVIDSTIENAQIASITLDVYSTSIGGIARLLRNSTIASTTVSGLTINSLYDSTAQVFIGGGFTTVDNSSSITGLVMAGVTINAHAGNIGGMAASVVNSSIAGSSVAVDMVIDTTIDSTEEARAGLVWSLQASSIDECFSIATITAVAGFRASHAGLIGHMQSSTALNSYSNGGTITSGTSFGSTSCFVISVNDFSSVNKCYSANIADRGFSFSEGAGTVTNSYYNADLISTSSSEATGKTTAEMYQEATFSDWDFASIWSIEEGTDYPRLQWAIPEPEPLLIKFGIGTLKFSTNGALKFGGIE